MQTCIFLKNFVIFGPIYIVVFLHEGVNIFFGMIKKKFSGYHLYAQHVQRWTKSVYQHWSYSCVRTCIRENFSGFSPEGVTNKIFGIIKKALDVSSICTTYPKMDKIDQVTIDILLRADIHMFEKLCYFWTNLYSGFLPLEGVKNKLFGIIKKALGVSSICTTYPKMVKIDHVFNGYIAADIYIFENFSYFFRTNLVVFSPLRG